VRFPIIPLIVIVVVFCMLNGCGGGFKSDSENESEVNESIFGPDSAY
jgi:hypothetical protein